MDVQLPSYDFMDMIKGTPYRFLPIFGLPLGFVLVIILFSETQLTGLVILCKFWPYLENVGFTSKLPSEYTKISVLDIMFAIP